MKLIHTIYKGLLLLLLSWYYHQAEADFIITPFSILFKIKSVF